jgi:hypothetical protein
VVGELYFFTMEKFYEREQFMYNLDVEEGNVDVVVPIGPCMFMIEAQGVHDLMSHRSFVLYKHKQNIIQKQKCFVAGVNKE